MTFSTLTTNRLQPPIEKIPTRIDYLIIGGGGGGGANVDGSGCGGGGAGGYTESFMTPVSGTTYTVTVGGGGAGAVYNNPFNGIGTASSAFSVSAIGGGRGRSVVNGPAWQGQTDNGGGAGGGGGGTGGAASGANGGPGATSTLSLSSVARGGGGAGTGGSAGSGQGANTGSGGSSGVNYGGAGSTGVVLVRQLTTERLPSVLTGTPIAYSNGTYVTFMFTGSGSIGWS